jgi:hypothetical protein
MIDCARRALCFVSCQELAHRGFRRADDFTDVYGFVVLCGLLREALGRIDNGGKGPGNVPAYRG